MSVHETSDFIYITWVKNDDGLETVCSLTHSSIVAQAILLSYLHLNSLGFAISVTFNKHWINNQVLVKQAFPSNASSINKSKGAMTMCAAMGDA